MRIIFTFLLFFSILSNFASGQSSLDNGIEQNISNCPLMEVSIEISAINKNEYKISFCNHGNATAINAYIDISFTNNIEINHASIPVLHHGNIFTFDLGNVSALDCGTFDIEVPASNIEMYCTNVHIYPDQPCQVTTGQVSSGNDNNNDDRANMAQQRFAPGVNFIDIGTSSVFEDNVILTNVPIWDTVQSFNQIRGSDHNSISPFQVHQVGYSNNGGSSNINKLSTAEYCKTSENNTNTIIKEFDFENAIISHTDQTGVHSGETYIKPNLNSNESKTSNKYFDDGEEVFVNIYPNPFRDYTTIKVDKTSHKNLIMNIVDITGKTVEVLQILDQKTILDRTGLNSGIYFYYLIGHGETLFSGKLIVD